MAALLSDPVNTRISTSSAHRGSAAGSCFVSGDGSSNSISNSGGTHMMGSAVLSGKALNLKAAAAAAAQAAAAVTLSSLLHEAGSSGGSGGGSAGGGGCDRHREGGQLLMMVVGDKGLQDSRRSLDQHVGALQLGWQRSPQVCCWGRSRTCLCHYDTPGTATAS